MNKRLFGYLLLFCSLSLSGQYQYQRLNQLRELRFVAAIYQPGTDFHSSIRPLDCWQLDSIVSSRQWQQPLQLQKSSWLGRKLFNEHLADISGTDYYITLDPLVNFRAAFDPLLADEDLYYVNTRGFNIDARLGEKVSFSTSFLENQALFPQYIRSYDGVIPGQGKERSFANNGSDYGMASGELSFTPGSIFSFSLGQGRNFFGEGYRSMLLSDVAFNYPYFRIASNFWKIKYVNLWAQLYDLRQEATVGAGHAKKFLSSHYLSINFSDRLNLSFFEAIVVGDTNQLAGPDVSFFNPVIFYRPVEFAVGSRQGNALMGLNTSYKLRQGLQLYGQFILDEFSISDLLESEGSWVNKFGWQLGLKQYNTLGVEGLFSRLEYNGARPYTYSHREVLTNYAHYSQPLAHPWGANFREGLAQLIWQQGRWEVEGRLHLGLIGLDTATSNYGADLYRSYNSRVADRGNTVGQGLRAGYHFLMLRAAWLINPASGLKFEAGMRWRQLGSSNPPVSAPLSSGESLYLFLGLRSEFFNRYYDF